MSFLIEDILKILFFFPCVFIIATVKNLLYGLGHIETELINWERRYGSNFPLKYYK